MRYTPFLVTLLTFICFASYSCIEANAKTYTVFSGSKSDYAIVVSNDASESELYAASELQKYIREIGDVNLPIVGCDEWKKGKRIIVGYNKDSKACFRRMKQPNSSDESFFYRSKRGDIIIVGGSERGTMYAVFSFLENELGCRWYTKDCTLLPARESYSFKKLNHKEAPAFFKRNIIYSEISDPSFRVHCRINERLITAPKTPVDQIGGRYVFLAPHTFSFILPVDKYYKEHPEYFALVNGKRVKEQTQPCFSNPDVLKICIEEVKTIMREHPEFDIVELSALDNRNQCKCLECTQIIDSLGNYTDLFLNFVNQVADSVREEFPERKIEYLAYSNTRTPPLSIKPRDNVIIRICNHRVCHIHGFANCESDESKQFYNDVVEWKKVTDNLCCWEYATNFTWYNIPFPNFYALQDNFALYNKLGFKGAFVQGNNYSYNGEFQALRIYVLTKLLWNPNLNLEEIIDDFISGYYGSSATYVRQYFDLIHSYIREDTHITPFSNYSESYYNEEMIAKARALFNKAKAFADNSEILKRLEVEELSICLLKTIMNPQEAIEDGSYEQAKKVIEREKIDVGSDNSEKALKRRVAPYVSPTSSCSRITNKIIVWADTIRTWFRSKKRSDNEA